MSAAHATLSANRNNELICADLRPIASMRIPSPSDSSTCSQNLAVFPSDNRKGDIGKSSNVVLLTAAPRQWFFENIGR